MVLVVPICVEPLYVVSSKVPLKLLIVCIAFNTVIRCAAVSVIVLEPLASVRLGIVNIAVEPFLITSLCVKLVLYTVTLIVIFAVALSAVKLLTDDITDAPSVLIVEADEVP